MKKSNLLQQNEFSKKEPNGNRADTPTSDGVGAQIAEEDEFLNLQFTRDLIEHMHRAKIAALTGKQE